MSETTVRTLKDVVTFDDVVVYTEGDCWLLAWDLHVISGLDLVLSGHPSWWDHVALIASDDHVLDVKGWMTLDEWKKEWSPNTWRLTNLTTFADYCERLMIPESVYPETSEWGRTHEQTIEMANFLWERPVHAGRTVVS